MINDASKKEDNPNDESDAANNTLDAIMRKPIPVKDQIFGITKELSIVNPKPAVDTLKISKRKAKKNDELIIEEEEEDD